MGRVFERGMPRCAAGDLVAVGACTDCQAVLVYSLAGMTCRAAGLIGNVKVGHPRTGCLSRTKVVRMRCLFGGRFVDVARLFGDRITNRRCGHCADPDL